MRSENVVLLYGKQINAPLIISRAVVGSMEAVVGSMKAVVGLMRAIPLSMVSAVAAALVTVPGNSELGVSSFLILETNSLSPTLQRCSSSVAVNKIW